MAGISIGIMGGTFDPVHNGHLALAEAGRRELGLERVVWVPAGDPWRKADRLVALAAHRVAMVRLAIEGNRAFLLSTVEVDRPGPSYTVDTLEELGRQDPDVTLFLLLGEDALHDLPNWKEPSRLLQLAKLAVAPRGEERAPPDELERLLAGAGSELVRLSMARVDIDATDLRRRAAAGESLRPFVPDAVAAYVREHGLYRHAV